MKIEDLKLTIVKDPYVGGYTAWMDAFCGIIVQTETLDEIPAEIAKSLEVMLMYGFDKKVHTIYEPDKPKD